MTVIDLSTGLNMENVQVARELDHEDDFANLVIESSLDGILVCRPSGEITIWSPAMERISGMKKSEVIGRRWQEAFPWLLGTPVETAWYESLAGRPAYAPPIAYHVPETNAQGYTEQTDTPIFNEKKEVIGVLAVVRDVTESRRAFDALTEENRALKARLESSET
jgi:PAS domain S-box-containing protein